MKFRIVVFSLLLLAAACAPPPQIRSDKFLNDTSLVSGEPCAAPCWRNITPGETKWSDALIFLEDDASLANLETQADENSDRLGAAWSPAEGELCCQMFSEDGEEVSFIILQTTPDMTFEQVIEKHGEPEYLTGEAVSDDQGIFSLFYPDVPMMVYVFVAGESGALGGSNEVVGFAYTTSELMTLLLDTSELHAWEGFQSYSDYMGGALEVTPSITLTPVPE